MQEQEQLGEQTPIEALVGLELDFDEDERVVAVRVGREQAVEAQGGLFQFLGAEGIARRGGGVEAGQVQRQRGPAAEQFVEQAVGFHGL